MMGKHPWKFQATRRKKVGNSCLLTLKDWATWIVDVGEWIGGQLCFFISPTELAGGLEFSAVFFLVG